MLKTRLLIAFIASLGVVHASHHSLSASLQSAEPSLTEKEGRMIVARVIGLEGVDGPGQLALQRKGIGTVKSIVLFTPSLRGKIVDADTASFLNYTLRLTRSEDKRHFHVALTPDSGCGTAWFGSEEKVIYSGRAVRCEK